MTDVERLIADFEGTSEAKRIEKAWSEIVYPIEDGLFTPEEMKRFRAVEYGAEKEGVLFPPKPFMRITENDKRSDWDAEIERIAELWLTSNSDRKVRQLVEELRDEMRLAYYRVAIGLGVDKAVVWSLER